MGTLRQELYHHSYQRVGVCFCSLPNFQEFYTELDGSNQGVECLRLLNEIIADFDELLCDERFHAIDKIKTIGSTYMAAVGLIPEYKIIPNDPHSARRLMTSLIEFVRAMRVKLKNINDNSYNNFMLRVGVNVGAVVSGVIGARKPQYGKILIFHSILHLISFFKQISGVIRLMLHREWNQRAFQVIHK